MSLASHSSRGRRSSLNPTGAWVPCRKIPLPAAARKGGIPAGRGFAAIAVPVADAFERWNGGWPGERRRQWLHRCCVVPASTPCREEVDVGAPISWPGVAATAAPGCRRGGGGDAGSAAPAGDLGGGAGRGRGGHVGSCGVPFGGGGRGGRAPPEFSRAQPEGLPPGCGSCGARRSQADLPGQRRGAPQRGGLPGAGGSPPTALTPVGASGNNPSRLWPRTLG